MARPSLEQKTFILLLVVVSLAFGIVIYPFYGAIFWAVILALIFAPLNKRFLGWMHGRRNLAALVTLLICVFIAVLPVVLITVALVQEVVSLYTSVHSGQLDIGQYIDRIRAAIPGWATGWLNRFGIGDLEGLRNKLSQSAMAVGQNLGTRALSFGQNAFDFTIQFCLMLYLLFFFFRDGERLAQTIIRVVPMNAVYKKHLFKKFTTVVKATVKGSVAVALAHGFLGWAAFLFFGVQGALLWGVMMAFLSLVPAVGAALIWGPVAIYFLATGQTWQGVALILYGALIMGSVDNVLRPLLVGKDTKLPDYVVLVSTLGGLALAGLNGFVLGPLVAALFISAWGLLERERDDGGTTAEAARQIPLPPADRNNAPEH